MASIKELIQALYDKRRKLIEQQRELHAQVEADLEGTFTGETQAKWDVLDKEINELGQRVDNLISMEEQSKDTEVQRERFEKLISTPSVQAEVEQSMTNRMKTWLRAALPNADVWAPASIELRYTAADLERHDLTKGTTAAGAALVPTGFVNQIQEHLVSVSGIRQTNVQVFTTTSGENLLVPKTTGHGTATLIAEGAAVLESDPAFAQVTLGAYKFGVLIQVSNELLTDQSDGLLLPYLARAVGTSIGTAESTFMWTGTGTAQPEGVANLPTAGVTGAVGSTTSVTTDNLIDLYHSLLPGYRARATWMMNDLTAAFIRKIKDTTNQYLWQPGVTAGTPDTILGRPVITNADVAVMAANAYSVAFGDFSAFYAIRDVGSLRFERSDDFAFANDLITFRALVRTDGRQLVNGANGALKFYRNSAT